MAIATLTTLDAFTKEHYGPDYFEQWNPETPLLSRAVIGRGTQGVRIRETSMGGREFNFPALFGAGESNAWIADGGALPIPGSPTGVDSTFKAKYHVGVIGLSGPAIDQMEDNRDAFVDAIELNMDTAMKSFHMDWATDIYGDATGDIGTVKSVAGSGPYTVTMVQGADVGSTVASTVMATSNVANMVWFRANMPFLAATARSGGTARVGSGVISDANPDTGVLTCSSIPTSLAAGDHLFTNALGGGSILMGLLGIVDDGTFVTTLQAVDRSTHSLWKSPVNSNGGVLRPFGLPLVRNLVSKIATRGGKVGFIVSDYYLKDQYAAAVQPDIRFSDPKEFDGGFVGLPYSLPNGKRAYWMTDQYSPYGTSYFLDPDSLRHFQVRAEDWDRRTGSIWKQNVTNTSSNSGYADAYIAYFKQYGEMGSFRPNASGVLRDIQES